MAVTQASMLSSVGAFLCECIKPICRLLVHSGKDCYGNIASFNDLDCRIPPRASWHSQANLKNLMKKTIMPFILVLACQSAFAASAIEPDPATLKDGEIRCKNGETGTVTGPVEVVKGFKGQALKITGPNSHITLPQAPGKGDFSISCYAKLSLNRDGTAGFAKCRGANGGQFMLGAAAAGNTGAVSQLEFRLWNNGKSYECKLPPFLFADQFYHFAVEVIGGKQIKVYVNGREFMQRELPDAIVPCASPLTIGNDGKSGGVFEIEQLTVYDGALPEHWQTTVMAEFPADWYVNPAIATVDVSNDKWVKLMKIKAAEGDYPLVFIGDSITAEWGRKGPKAEMFQKYFGDQRILNLGLSGGRTEQSLAIIRSLDWEKINAKAAMVMIGTNNPYAREDTLAGIRAILDLLKDKSPQTKILLLAIFPRGEKARNRVWVDEINAQLPALADEKRVFFMNINKLLLEPDGETLTKEIAPDLLHPSPMGNEIWARAVKARLYGLAGLPMQSIDTLPLTYSRGSVPNPPK